MLMATNVDALLLCRWSAKPAFSRIGQAYLDEVTVQLNATESRPRHLNSRNITTTHKLGLRIFVPSQLLVSSLQEMTPVSTSAPGSHCRLAPRQVVSTSRSTPDRTRITHVQQLQPR